MHARAAVLDHLRTTGEAATVREIHQALSLERRDVDNAIASLDLAGLVRRAGLTRAGRTRWEAVAVGEALAPGFYIWNNDTARPYVPRAWATLWGAREELAELLRYHQGTPWAARLVVLEVRALEGAA